MVFAPSATELKEFQRVARHVDADPNILNEVGPWKRICQRADVYRDAKRGYIIKCPNYINNPDTPIAVRVPTINIGVGDWVAQPVVKKVDRKRAVDLLRAQLGDVVCDLHHLNVGWYEENGKLVPKMFDW
jgi:hypothetical protein